MEYGVPEEYLDKIPEFAKIIFSDEKYVGKEKFVKHFLLRYIRDKNFRKYTEGMNVFFSDFKYHGVLEYEDIKNFNIPGYKKIIVEVNENPKDEYLLMQVNVNIGHYTDNNFGYTNLTIKYKNKTYKERRLIDTGATYSTIPCIDDWDYDNLIYFNNSDLTKNIEVAKSSPFITGGGKIEFKKIIWKEELNVGIENLPMLKTKFSVVPQKFTKNLNIIGMDIIPYYTMILSSYNGQVSMKILPSENLEDNNNTFNLSLGNLRRAIFLNKEDDEEDE